MRAPLVRRGGRGAATAAATTLPRAAQLLALLVAAWLWTARADVDDYRFLPTPSGGGHDVSYYINAACRSRGRLYMGGAFNLVGDAVAFNFGYFEGGNWTSPPVTIGPDPMTLLYHDAGLRSPDVQGKVLALLCPPPLPDGSTVVLIGGDFAKGGLRLGGAGGIPFVGPDGPRVLNHLAIYRVEPNPTLDSEASNLCPVLQGPLRGRDGRPLFLRDDPPAPVPGGGDQYAKVRCTPPDAVLPPTPPGALLEERGGLAKVTGPPEGPARAFVSSLACLNEACTEVLVGGSFNSMLGARAYSVARLRFDDHFYAAESLPVHDAPPSDPDAGDDAAAGSCAPYRVMGGFVDPIPGVNGAVHALTPLDDRYVAVAGSFDRAGAVAAPSVALWDRQANALLCLGKEGGRSECHASQFCCQGLSGDVRMAVALGGRRLLLGGAFADASSPSGVISANLAVLDFDAAGGGLDVSSWRRLRVVEAGPLGRDAGPNGPITSALCLDDDDDDTGEAGDRRGGGGDARECRRLLLGGWFDGLEAFTWNASSGGSASFAGGVAVYNATPSGLLPYPLLTLSLPPAPATPAAEDGLVAVLAPLDVSTASPSATNSTSWPGMPGWARPVVGVNALVHAPASAVIGPGAEGMGRVAVVGGKLSAVGNVAALVSQDEPGLVGDAGGGFVALPLVVMTRPDTPPEGPPCWESEAASLYQAEQQGLPIQGHGPSMSLCCFVGALCPFEGVAVSCPFAGGYFCLPNMTRPACCAEGYYCPDPGTIEECADGSYCPVGSTAMVPCAWWMWCRKPGLERPDKIMAGVAALVLVASIFIVLAVANMGFLFCRGRFRQARDNDRRRRGLLTARGTHNHELQADPTPRPSSSQLTSPSPPVPLAPPASTGSAGAGPTHSTNSAGGGGRGAGRAAAPRPLLRERAKVERIDLQFQGLTVELPGSKKRVLNGVTGGFRAGRVTAVMGPSGCGKTTLISALSNRLGWGTRVTGRTFINGQPESSTALHDVMGFVPQDDIMYEDLTVKENLTYCCQLRADPTMSRAEQRRHVDRVIDSLGLFPSRHSIIGSTEERGISGGQRKRVNVGMELTSKPLVLFLDEPTSGLDSTTAEELMQYLHRLTSTGLTIAAVIHQPRIEVFLGVDDVIFLGRGGRLAYYGAARDAVRYFSELGYHFEPTVNPADRILDIITKADDSLYEHWAARLAATGASPENAFGFWVPGQPKQHEQQSQQQADEGDAGQQQQQQQRTASGQRGALSTNNRRRHSAYGGAGGGVGAAHAMPVVYEEQLPQRRYPAFHSQAWTCLCRSLVQQHNNLGVAQQDLLMLMIFGLLVGLFDLGAKQYELSVLCMGLTSTLTGVRFFSAERVVFWRECSSGISIPAYFLGKVLSALPCTTLYPLAYLSFYFNMGFPRVSFGFYYLVLLWAGWVCFGVGVIMSLVFEPKNAQIGAVVVALVGFLFGGHNPNVVTLDKSAPGKIGMMLSYVRWSIGALLLQDASLAPQCGALEAVGALASEGFVSEALVQGVAPQVFQARVVDTEVAHCREMLVNVCILYLGTGMVLMWLSGRYRARMIGWDYFKVGLKQWRARLRDRFYGFLQRHQTWLPRWIIRLAARRERATLDEEEEEEDLLDEDYYILQDHEDAAGNGSGDGVGGDDGGSSAAAAGDDDDGRACLLPPPQRAGSNRSPGAGAAGAGAGATAVSGGGGGGPTIRVGGPPSPPSPPSPPGGGEVV